MKSKFSGYYNYSNGELRDILSNSIITLDYSLLLDINKLSHGRLMLDILNHFSERLWLPYDTAWMYHQNLQRSIEEQMNKVDSAKKYLTSFKNAADDHKSVVFITNRLSENWFLTYRNSVCVTNPFLRTEFEKITGKPFFCMSAHLFVRKFMPSSGNVQEYEKLLAQLHKTPQGRTGDSIELTNNQL